MVKKPTEDLADFVRRVRSEKNLSLEAVAARSGNQISRGYISQIENRYIVSVTTKKLEALAKGLGVTENELFDVARGKSYEGKDILDEVRVAFYGFDELSPEDKERTLEEVRFIAEMMQRRRSKAKRPTSKK